MTSFDVFEQVALTAVMLVVILCLAGLAWGAWALWPGETTAALAVFIFCCVLDLAGLLLDLVILLSCGVEHTITRYVRGHKLYGLPVVGLQVVLATSIGIHFYC